MAVQLSHTILKAHDRRRTAHLITEMLGLPEPEGDADDRVLSIRLSNDSSVDVMRVDDPIDSEHYAFLVSEAEFDAILDRVTSKQLDHWADPFHQEPGRINTHDGGRGVYFDDPNGHNLEVITTPYGTDAAEVGLVRDGKIPPR
ncbi:VOC family protein [Pseudonocardia kongjuensis]|uniref:VOC family protein n=1 Tax=Pseudonocardia kongjuensis TaxID=102227 RepID=A0ABN1XH06_9PSEU